MLTYDSTYIYEFADRLERSAREMIQGSIAAGILIGAAMGVLLGMAAAKEIGMVVGAVILGAVGAVIGRGIGTRAAFELRLKAHTALCQVQIEENTRPKE